jgi:2-oxo-4-hydroxy-4-carboxy-5-ureidoimidazoline decarboxylase
MFDELSDAAFVERMAPLFEGAPRFLGRLAGARPFRDADDLFRRAEAIALAMPADEQRELIDAHPRLGAPPATVSVMSHREQGYDRETEEAVEALDRLNEAYERRFGFRYCVFVNGRPRAALVPELETALGRDAGSERERALRDVVAIARDRYHKSEGGGR